MTDLPVFTVASLGNEVYQGSQDAPSGAYLIAGSPPAPLADSIRGLAIPDGRGPAAPRSGKAVTRD